MGNVQLLVYCRYIHLWSILYLLNIIYFSPLITLMIVNLFHLYNITLNSKRIGIVVSDIVLIIIISNRNVDLYIYENICVFFIYINILLLKNINPIVLYTIELKEDDEKYKDENYLEYINRLFNLYAS